MLRDIKGAAARVGLELHPDKTNILSNATRGTGRPKEPKVMIGDMGIDIVPASGSHRAELTDRSYPLNARLLLFDSTVTVSYTHLRAHETGAYL
eukprot:7040349-Pyramimonas_sp.AAC.1